MFNKTAKQSEWYQRGKSVLSELKREDFASRYGSKGRLREMMSKEFEVGSRTVEMYEKAVRFSDEHKVLRIDEGMALRVVLSLVGLSRFIDRDEMRDLIEKVNSGDVSLKELQLMKNSINQKVRNEFGEDEAGRMIAGRAVNDDEGAMFHDSGALHEVKIEKAVYEWLMKQEDGKQWVSHQLPATERRFIFDVARLSSDKRAPRYDDIEVDVVEVKPKQALRKNSFTGMMDVLSRSATRVWLATTSSVEGIDERLKEKVGLIQVEDGECHVVWDAPSSEIEDNSLKNELLARMAFR